MESIGFIGAGQMAQALGGGIANVNRQIKFVVCDPNAHAIDNFIARVGKSRVSVVDTNCDVLNHAEMAILAVKPQYVSAALQGVKDNLISKPLLVSILAGTSIATLEKLTGLNRIVRVMPNTPCLIGHGASAIAISANVDPATMQQDLNTVHQFLESVGTVVRVSEPLIDSVTGLSGSGPAFVFNFIEALIQGAVMTGLPADTARTLALQTVSGAAEMVRQTNEHTSVLRDRVTSPGGTTIAGLKELESKNFRDAVMSAVIAATQRSRELAKLASE